MGIELENRGWQTRDGVKTFTPFAPAQIAALIPLAGDIIARYDIQPQNVVAHADIARSVKTIPAHCFRGSSWRSRDRSRPDPARVAFYLNGRPRYQEVERGALLDVLKRYGYEVPDNATEQQQKRVISAFQMHFRPALWNGVADVETAIAEALLEKYGQG